MGINKTISSKQSTVNACSTFLSRRRDWDLGALPI